LSWIDNNWKRQLVVLAIGYQTGKKAVESARHVRTRIKHLGVLGAIQSKLDRSEVDTGAAKHFKQKMLKYSAEFVPVLQAEDAEVSGPDPQTDGSDDEVISEDEDAVDTTTVGADDAKSIAALVAYMVGGATTDGAILHLMEKLIGADNNGVADGEDRITTHWCNAHRISLLSRFAFAQKTNERIQPLKTCFRLQMAKLTDVLKDLVAFFSENANFNLLESYAKKKKELGAPVRMNALCETRFNSFADLLLAVQHNMKIFSDVRVDTTPSTDDEDRTEEGQLVNKSLVDLREGFEALYTTFTIKYNDEAGDAKTQKFTPYKYVNGLTVIARCLIRISKLAETNDQDPFIFEAELSALVRQLDCRPGEKLSYTIGEGKNAQLHEQDFVVLKKLPFLGDLGEVLQSAIGYYFDAKLDQDWPLLICMILHPCCSGSKKWLCLGGRFQHVYQKLANGEWDTQDTETMRMRVMTAGQKTLREELELQYDIDTAAAVASDQAEVVASSAPLAAKKSKLLYDEDDEAMELAIPPSTKAAAVEAELNRWLTRPPNKEASITMLQYWKNEPDCMLRRVAMRVGAFMLSQCATERVNKLPKDVWTAKRMRLSTNSVLRDVFLCANKERLPETAFSWESVKY